MRALKALGSKLFGVTKRNTDIFLALAISMVVALLIIPIPTFLIDMLICLSIASSLTVLLVSIYISSSLKLSSFPSILLLATLFRLGLNVATSRLILLNANAGEMVYAFGQTVVGGNLLVGIVIFLILMLINLLVVAKGSERVAEVAARFALDAMPGKQMSIDADLRSGLLNLDQAKAKREEIERESQLFGAMDGAMKFVKGDSIAGIIIFFINIIAGIIIGIIEHGMNIEEALDTYAILSVGDGLVNIIPSLLMSICAGLIVTRVNTQGQDLGQNMSLELLAHPKAFMISALFISLLALIPGLPIIPLLLLSLALLLAAFLAKNDLKNQDSRIFLEKTISKNSSVTFALTPISIEVSENLVPFVDDKSGFISKLIPVLRESLGEELGFSFPGISVSKATDLANNNYRLLINEVPVAQSEADPERCLVQALPHELFALGISDAVFYPHPGLIHGSLISAKDKAIMEKSGFLIWDAPSSILLHLAAILRKNAKDFLSIHESQLLLDRLEKDYPNLVKEVVPNRVNLYQLTEVLKRLLSEEVSIKDMKSIVQTLAEFAPIEANGAALTEYVRQSLSRYLCFRFGHGQENLLVFLLASDIEDIIRTSIINQPGNSYLALEPELAKEILKAVRNALDQLPPGAKKPILLTSLENRRFVRKLIELEFYSLPVMSYEELCPEYKVQPIARITLPQEEQFPISFDELSDNPLTPAPAML